MTPKYKVLHNFSFGWDDAGWVDDFGPALFATRAEAEAAINEFLADTDDAVADGDMAFGYSRDDFQVVEHTIT